MEQNVQSSQKIGAVLVIGGGISGMQAALDLAESGFKVYLVEQLPAIGGRMVQLDKTFPTNECSMCVVSPKLVDSARHPNIEIITQTDVKKVEGEAGNFNVTLNKRPRYIREDKCTGCGLCVISCPVRNQVSIIHEEEKAKIELPLAIETTVHKIINEHRNKRGSLMLILQAINSIYHYFSPDVLRYLSRELNIPLSVILRIATFYNAFSLKPQGKHTINVCMGTTCYVRGSERLIEGFREVLNIDVEETTHDLNFTLKAVRCLGCCSIAPAIMIDDKVYGNVRVREITKILKDYQ